MKYKQSKTILGIHKNALTNKCCVTLCQRFMNMLQQTRVV